MMREFYDAVEAYYELDGKLAEAVPYRDRELEETVDRGKLWSECEVRLRRCRLFKELGETEPLAAESAAKLQAFFRARR